MAGIFNPLTAGGQVVVNNNDINGLSINDAIGQGLFGTGQWMALKSGQKPNQTGVTAAKMVLNYGTRGLFSIAEGLANAFGHNIPMWHDPAMPSNKVNNAAPWSGLKTRDAGGRAIQGEGSTLDEMTPAQTRKMVQARDWSIASQASLAKYNANAQFVKDPTTGNIYIRSQIPVVPAGATWVNPTTGKTEPLAQNHFKGVPGSTQFNLYELGAKDPRVVKAIDTIKAHSPNKWTEVAVSVLGALGGAAGGELAGSTGAVVGSTAGKIAGAELTGNKVDLGKVAATTAGGIAGGYAGGLTGIAGADKIGSVIGKTVGSSLVDSGPKPSKPATPVASPTTPQPTSGGVSGATPGGTKQPLSVGTGAATGGNVGTPMTDTTSNIQPLSNTQLTGGGTAPSTSTGGATGGGSGVASSLWDSLSQGYDNFKNYISSNAGNLAAFGGLAALGLGEAKSAQNQTAADAKKLSDLGQPYVAAGKGVLDKFSGASGAMADQQIAGAKQLGDIASGAFGDYKSNKLPDAIEQHLKQQADSAKAQLRASLGPNVDSNVLAEQGQSIDQQIDFTRQTLLDQRLQAGEQAFQQVQGAFNNLLNEALGASSLGMKAEADAIQLKIQSDAQITAALEQFFGAIATGYGLSQAPGGGAAGGSKGSGTPKLPSIGGGGQPSGGLPNIPGVGGGDLTGGLSSSDFFGSGATNIGTPGNAGYTSGDVLGLGTDLGSVDSVFGGSTTPGSNDLGLTTDLGNVNDLFGGQWTETGLPYDSTFDFGATDTSYDYADIPLG